MDNYVNHIQKIVNKNTNTSDSEKFRKMADFLDKNLPAIKPVPKTMPYPPPMGYGSLGKDVTDTILHKLPEKEAYSKYQ